MVISLVYMTCSGLVFMAISMKLTPLNCGGALVACLLIQATTSCNL